MHKNGFIGVHGGFLGWGIAWQHAPGLPLLPCGDGAQTVSNIKSGARERGTAPSVSRPTGYIRIYPDRTAVCFIVGTVGRRVPPD